MSSRQLPRAAGALAPLAGQPGNDAGRRPHAARRGGLAGTQHAGLVQPVHAHVRPCLRGLRPVARPILAVCLCHAVVGPPSPNARSRCLVAGQALQCSLWHGEEPSLHCVTSSARPQEWPHQAHAYRCSQHTTLRPKHFLLAGTCSTSCTSSCLKLLLICRYVANTLHKASS